MNRIAKLLMCVALLAGCGAPEDERSGETEPVDIGQTSEAMTVKDGGFGWLSGGGGLSCAPSTSLGSGSMQHCYLPWAMTQAGRSGSGVSGTWAIALGSGGLSTQDFADILSAGQNAGNFINSTIAGIPGLAGHISVVNTSANDTNNGDLWAGWPSAIHCTSGCNAMTGVATFSPAGDTLLTEVPAKNGDYRVPASTAFHGEQHSIVEYIDLPQLKALAGIPLNHTLYFQYLDHVMGNAILHTLGIGTQVATADSYSTNSLSPPSVHNAFTAHEICLLKSAVTQNNFNVTLLANDCP